ncbi:peptide/nickel transport system permease protein [Pustulibacterium marinum]|uniref:Peptide/nickel transport system permease protein n=1 Tax=Pustulibacterium marinum TaxID=1224947 RepID=A0A1I7EV77_9FLAO|nr:ABC transporter permease [Pustulibacterium marinum]SFU27803.1 peptide/nickel transport system permease protein [Pustulibacterium marinum]
MAEASGSLTAMALQKFKRNFWGVFSLSIVLLCGFVAVFAYVLAPDDSTNANQMHISIHSQKPGFQVSMLTIPGDKLQEKSFLNQVFFGKQNNDTEIPLLSYRFSKDSLYYKEFKKEGTMAIEKGIDLETSFGTRNASEIKEQFIHQKTFLLGTDKYGRDLLSRMLVGARISFSIGFVAVFISLLVGISLGALAGYFGGKIDALIMWLINVTWSIPTLLLVIGITLALGKGFWQVFIAVGLTMWVEVARVVRGQIVSAKEMQYVTAARALGYSNTRIITKHILPNIMAPVIVISAANFAAAILIESGLSFLGIGAQPPVPSWGAMIKDHYNYIILGKAYLAIIPGLAIMILVMSFMLIGNALRDAFDVKN